jgi:hypothetical protein
VHGQDTDVLSGCTVTGVMYWAADPGANSRSVCMLDVSNVKSGGTHSDGWNREGKMSEWDTVNKSL